MNRVPGDFLPARRFAKIPSIDFKLVIILLIHRGFSREKISEETGVSLASLFKYTAKKGTKPGADSAKELWNYAIEKLCDEDLNRCIYHD